VPLREVAPGVPAPVAAAVTRGLATEPADRFATAEAFGTALAEAGTQAWGPGWMSAEQVPIMDAGPIMSGAGYPSGPRRAAPAVAAAGSPAGAAIPARPPSDRRRTLIIVAVVLVIIVIAVLAVFVLPKMFTVYHSSAGFGLRFGATR